jgi:hypothetical protein
VAFLLTSWSSVEWIAMAFQTITPKHQDVQQISIHIPYYLAIDGADANIRGTIGEADYRQWLNLESPFSPILEIAFDSAKGHMDHGDGRGSEYKRLP